MHVTGAIESALLVVRGGAGDTADGVELAVEGTLGGLAGGVAEPAPLLADEGGRGDRHRGYGGRLDRDARLWAGGAELDGGAASVRQPGGKPADLGTLGWDGPLETYRPFLSYNELGSMLDAGPTELHDRLSTRDSLPDTLG